MCMKTSFLFALVLLCASFAANGQTTDVHTAVADLLVIERDAEAVHNEVYLYTRWNTDEPARLESTAREAIDAVDRFREKLAHLETPETEAAQRLLRDMFRLQQDLYRTLIEYGPSDPRVPERFISFNKERQAFLEEADRLFPNRMTPPGYTSVSMEDHAAYVKQAEPLLDGPYREDLATLWRNWRALYQAEHHVMSNYSLIPNNLYNQRRKEVLTTVRTYLSAHPDDKTALDQLRYLAWAPNIMRGGLMGHFGLLEWDAATADDEDAPASASGDDPQDDFQ